MEEESHVLTDLAKRINAFCKEAKRKKKDRNWESHKQVLNALKENKSKQLKQPDKEEREVVYSQITQGHGKNKGCGTKINESSFYHIS